ncbi:MAG: sensor histidine kinase [Eubacterium sp.]|nr:sensor histidine kinase [Eubacterium sp.]
MGSFLNEKILKDKYFLIVRIIIMLLFCVYGLFDIKNDTGVSAEILLLISLFISMICLQEFVDGKKKLIFLVLAAGTFAALLYFGGMSFIFLGAFLYYEILICLKAGKIWYYMIYVVVLLEWFFLKSSLEYSTADILVHFIIMTFMVVFYMQHEFVVTDYEKQMMEDTITQQGMKRDMQSQTTALREQMKKNILMSENKILEERAQLSQTLHDKLGHNINGSIYQLEAAKVIMEKDPEKAKNILQAVIDQLRTGMDEIRAILRKERPDKKQMALLQLYELCEDCNGKGVETELDTEGDLSRISSDMWEMILDNAFEAVSNSMKYARCDHIDITIVVMNKMVRCSISDNGVGCSNIVDGMGLSGMRKRVRLVGGSIDFETGAGSGFKVNMLLPI